MKEELAKFNDLVAQVNQLNASSDPLDALMVFKELRWSVLNLDNAIMTEIFGKKEAV
jgi:hypothetical protein